MLKTEFLKIIQSHKIHDEVRRLEGIVVEVGEAIVNLFVNGIGIDQELSREIEDSFSSVKKNSEFLIESLNAIYRNAELRTIVFDDPTEPVIDDKLSRSLIRRFDSIVSTINVSINYLDNVKNRNDFSCLDDAAFSLEEAQESIEKVFEKLGMNHTDMDELLKNIKKSDDENLQEDLLNQDLPQSVTRELNEAIAKIQAEHEHAEALRNKEFNDRLDAANQKLEDTQANLQKFSATSENAKQKIVEKQNEIITFHKEIENFHKEIENLHEIVANDGVVGSYKETARKEREQANLWRYRAMGLFGFTIAWLVFLWLWLGVGFNYFGSSITASENTNWMLVFTNISLTAVLLATTTYCAAQSKLHRADEQQMKWASLDIAAFEPFMKDLPEGEQNELRKALAEKLFGKNRITTSGFNKGNDNQELLEIIKSLIAQAVNKDT